MRKSHFLLHSYSYGAHVGLAKDFTLHAWIPPPPLSTICMNYSKVRICANISISFNKIEFILTKKIYLFSIFKENSSLSRHACGMGGSLHHHYDFHPLFFSSASALSSQWEKRPNQYKWLINPIDSMTSLHMCKLTSVESMVECAGLSIILQIKHITMQKLLIIFPY